MNGLLDYSFKGHAAPPPIRLKRGMRLRIHHRDYIIAQTGAGTACLIDLDGGNRHCDPIKVGTVIDISYDELQAMCGSTSLKDVMLAS